MSRKFPSYSTFNRTLVLAVMCGFSSHVGAQVVPDGATSTTTNLDPSTGATTVQIAPVGNASAISHNTYTDFSVSPSGVSLDNRSVNARTILNEVTSSKVSNLNGPLEVLGSRAHVIIANPNGISVDGGSFRKTGGVVLSTGKPSIVTRQITSSTFQDNIVLNTSKGRIDVGPGGLSGAMATLHMMAANIGIDGPVENSSSNLRSSIELTAGDSSVEYDSSIVPQSDIESWGRKTDGNKANGSVAVEITSRGTLKANTVRITATNKGAGVSHAGKGLASFNDFTINTSGKVVSTGSIAAARNVRITAGSLDARSKPNQPQSTIEAINGSLTLLAETGGISNTGVLMSGSRRDAADPASNAAVTIRAAGDVSLLTETGDQLAIVFAAKDNLTVRAGGTVINNTGRLLSNGSTTIEAGGNISNIADINNSVGIWRHQKTKGSRLWYTLWQKRETAETVTLDYGNPRLPGQQPYIAGTSVTLMAGGGVINRGGTINANAGKLRIEGKTILNEADVSGSLQFHRRCRLTCIGYGSSTIDTSGGAINANSDIDLVASSSIVNRYGQIVSFGSLRALAPTVSLQGGALPTIVSRPPGLYNFWSGPTAWIGTRDFGGTLYAAGGSLTVTSFKPVQVNAGVLKARDGVFVPSGINTLNAASAEDYPFGLDSIGLFQGMVGR